MSDLIASTRVRLRRFKGRFPEICERSGLGYSWVSKFSSGERGANPSFDHITRLQRALAELEALPPPTNTNPPVRRTPVDQGASTEATEPVLTPSTTTAVN